MKRSRSTIFLPGVWAVCTVALGFYLASTQGWSLVFRGQQRMFQFDWSYIADILFHPGGLAALVADFLLQCFTSRGVAAGITAVIFGFNSWMVWKLMLRTARSGGRFSEIDDDQIPGVWGLFPACFLPSLLLAASLLDYYYFYQSIIAFTAAVFCLYEYSKTDAGKLPLWQGCLMTLLLFFLAGSVALLFAVRALLFDIFIKRPKAPLAVAYPAIALVLGLLAYGCGWIPTLYDAFTPKMYYEVNILRMPATHLASWVALSVCIFIAAVSRRAVLDARIGKGAVFVVLALLTLLAGHIAAGSLKSDSLSRIHRLECLAADNDWDGIIRIYGRDVRNLNEANYLNLALCEKGLLSEDLFKYRQNGPLSLISDVKAQNDLDLLRLARVLFAMGNMGAAQSAAFNADQAFGDHVPSMLGMVLDIDLMRGAYRSAEKYIGIMEKSPWYRSEASSRRVFLDNDVAVEADSTLGDGRRCLGCENAFVLYTNPMDDLFRIVDANPADRKAMDYSLAYLLLAKDMDNVVAFVEKHYGEPALRTLPTPAQECLLFYSDYYGTMNVDFAISHGMSAEDVASRQERNLDWCLAHGVTEDAVSRFRKFKDHYGKAAGSQNPQTALSSFRTTFWYYLLFTQI